MLCNEMFENIWLDSIEYINKIGDEMNCKNIKIYKLEGFALPLVLMVVAVLSILFISVFSISQSNTKHVVTQEDNLRAYYLARSGIDIAYAALMEESKGELKIQKFIKDTKTTSLYEKLALPKADDPVGFVEIEVTKSDEEVRIKATAKMVNGSGTSTLSLYIDKNNFSNIKWVKG